MGKSRNLAKLVVDSSGDVDLSSLDNVDALPSQSGQSGKFLTTDGTNASWATVTMPDEIRDPVNSTPANGSGGQLETPTLTSSAFRSLYGETHSKSQWQVSTASNFASTVVSTGDSDSLTSYTLSAGVLSTSTTYYWRVRYKDSNGTYSDWSTATTFITASSFTYAVEYLVIAGGGGGSDTAGGGAGGYRTSVSGALSGGGASAEVPAQVAPGSSYSVVVGSGGTGGSNNAPSRGTKGQNSSFGSIVSIGGGAGGAGFANSDVSNGESGGSGGGGSTYFGSNNQRFGGAGTSGQGYAGGNSLANYWTGGGGGGAGAVGQNASGANSDAGVAGNGGAGVSSSITGSAVTRAGGGGGAQGNTGAGGDGGAGGGGAGGKATSTNGGNGTANTGSGGGGTWDTLCGNGGSGIVIIRYSGSQRGTGGTVTSSGGYTIHTFTTSGTYTA